MKDIFELLKEGSLEEIKELIETDKSLIKSKDFEKRNLIMLASQRGDTEIFNYLLSKKAPFKGGDSEKNTALHYAIQGNNFEILKALLDKGLKIEQENKEKSKAIDLIYRKTSLEVFNLLIDTMKANEGDYFYRVLYLGNLEIVNYLYSKESVTKIDENKFISIISNNNNLELLNFLIDELKLDVSKNTIIDSFDELNIIQHYIDEYYLKDDEKLEIVKFLIENSADINYLDHGSRDAMYYALKNNNLEIAEILLKAKSSIPKLGKYLTKFDNYHYSDLRKSIKISTIKFIIDNVKNIDLGLVKKRLLKEMSDSDRMLDNILGENSIKNIKYFIDIFSLDIENKYFKINYNKYNLFTRSVFLNKLELVKEFIKMGADVNRVDRNDNTPICNALDGRDESVIEILEVLKENGADLNFKIGKHRKSLLLKALINDSYHSSKFLFEQGLKLEVSINEYLKMKTYSSGSLDIPSFKVINLLIDNGIELDTSDTNILEKILYSVISEKNDENSFDNFMYLVKRYNIDLKNLGLHGFGDIIKLVISNNSYSSDENFNNFKVLIDYFDINMFSEDFKSSINWYATKNFEIFKIVESEFNIDFRNETLLKKTITRAIEDLSPKVLKYLLYKKFSLLTNVYDEYKDIIKSKKKNNKSRSYLNAYEGTAKKLEEMTNILKKYDKEYYRILKESKKLNADKLNYTSKESIVDKYLKNKNYSVLSKEDIYDIFPKSSEAGCCAGYNHDSVFNLVKNNIINQKEVDNIVKKHKKYLGAGDWEVMSLKEEFTISIASFEGKKVVDRIGEEYKKDNGDGNWTILPLDKGILLTVIMDDDENNIADFSKKMLAPTISLKGKELVSANFVNTIVRDVDFSNCDLTKAVFLNSFIEGADFSNADLSNVDFSRSNLTNCNFDGAILYKTDFEDCNLTNTVFVNAKNIDEAMFPGAILENIVYMTEEDEIIEKLDSPWIDINKLPKLYFKTGGEISTKITLILLSAVKNFGQNAIVVEQINTITDKSILELFKYLRTEVYKEMWIYDLLYVLAENNASIFTEIEKHIEYYGYSGGYHLQSQLINKLADITNIESLKLIYKLTKSKRNSIKNSANSAFRTKSYLLDVTIEELKDMLISDFGLDSDKELVLDYGTRNITVKLMPDFKLKFTDYSINKTYKSLPKASKDDDADKVDEASKFIKKMKKEMKKIVSDMKSRLNSQFVNPKFSKFSYWEQLFVKNPILNVFASNIFWGIYNKEGELEKIFIYSEDGTYIDINQDEITLNENDLVSIVHPIELTKKELEKLKSFIDDYELIQPITQISRQVFKPKDGKLKAVTDFNKKVVKSSVFHYGLTNAGFSRGMVEDNGTIFTYYMDVKNIEVLVIMSGIQIGVYDSSVIEIKDIVFMKGDKIELGKVDKRVFSEVYLALHLL